MDKLINAIRMNWETIHIVNQRHSNIVYVVTEDIDKVRHLYEFTAKEAIKFGKLMIKHGKRARRWW